MYGKMELAKNFLARCGCTLVPIELFIIDRFNKGKEPFNSSNKNNIIKI